MSEGVVRNKHTINNNIKISQEWQETYTLYNNEHKVKFVRSERKNTFYSVEPEKLTSFYLF